MKKILLLVFISTSLFMGCSSVYLYETEKVSLTVESRGDPTQPVSANLGIKQRVALIVPGKGEDQELDPDDIKKLDKLLEQVEGQDDKKNYSDLVAFITILDSDKRQKAINLVTDKISKMVQVTSTDYRNWLTSINNIESGKAPGEATSVVSYFNYDYKANTWSLNDNITTIDTVILTGDAASGLKRVAPQVFKEISSAESLKYNPILYSNLSLMYKGLRTLSTQGDNMATQHKSALDELHTLVPDKYQFPLYDSIPGSIGDFKKSIDYDDPIVNNDRFTDVTSYLTYLNFAIARLAEMIDELEDNDGNDLKINGNLPPREVIESLKSNQKNLQPLLAKKQAEVSNNPFVKTAVDYYIKKTFKE